MQPGFAWRLLFDECGSPHHCDSDGTVAGQTTRDGMQRIADATFKTFSNCYH